MQNRFLKSRPLYGVLAAIVLAVLLFQYVLAPQLVRFALNRLVTKPCGHCSLLVDSVVVQIFRPGFSLKGVRFSANVGGNTTLSANISELTMQMYFLGLFEKKLHLGPIVVRDPVVNVVERDLANHRETQGGKADSALVVSLEVDGILMHGGDFTYVHEVGSKQGAVRVHEIELQIQRFGTIAELRKKKFYGHALGRLEKSGRFELNASADFFSAEPDVDVELFLKGQNLSDLNHYFDPADGVKLEGKLLEGHALVSIDGTVANSKAVATYENLAFTAQQEGDRSALGAFLINFFGGLAMGSHNLYDTAAEKMQTATLQREPGQTVLAFILQSMKAAALKIPTRK